MNIDKSLHPAHHGRPRGLQLNISRTRRNRRTTYDTDTSTTTHNDKGGDTDAGYGIWMHDPSETHAAGEGEEEGLKVND